jgi:hypothetical protein
MTRTAARIAARIAAVLAAALSGTVGCGQEVQDRPGGAFRGSFRAPPASGGGGDEDAGVGDGGLVVTRTVEGRVVDIDDLADPPGSAPGVPERQVAGYDPDGDLVTAVSAADGTFRLEGLARSSPLILSASGDPPSFVVLETHRVDDALIPVIDAAMLQEVAASVSTAPAEVTGHAFLWLEDGRGEPALGLGVEVLSAAPLEGPFYGTTDPTQVTTVPPTDAEALVVILNAVAGTLQLSVFRLDAPADTETISLPIEAGVVTFYEVTTGL